LWASEGEHLKTTDAPGLTPGARCADVTAFRDGRAVRGVDSLAEEVPVALIFNGISHAVMLATPLDLEDFALGFGLTEGLLESVSELYGVEIESRANGIEVQLEVGSACEFRLKARRRNLSGRTGCGLCGTESLDQVMRTVAALDTSLQIAPAAVAQALRSLRDAQRLQDSTGASHAAAWCDASGAAVLVREDVGRHNALDKLVGALVRSKSPAREGFIAVTSRASLEMVQKTAMAGVSILVAVSAPTALAVEVAQQCGVALAGFARGEDLVCYNQPERFGLNIQD
jgi:FdhD protein